MGLKDEAIVPLKRALDDMPVHVKQLAHMFRRHGTQHRRNRGQVTELDAQRVPQDLRDGWNEGGVLPTHVVQTRKGDRPDPGSYLNADYIEQHRRRFDDGGVRFYRTASLDQWGPANRGTTFIFPKSEFDSIQAAAGGDPRRLGDQLGLGDDFFVDADGNPVPVQIASFSPGDLADGDVRIPSGNEGGANDYWIPGGYLQNGIPEAVIDLPPSGGRGSFEDFDFGAR